MEFKTSEKLRARSREYHRRKYRECPEYRAKKAEAERRRKAENREKYLEKAWSRQLKHNYGITAEQYHEMLADQGGGCAICGSDKPGKKKKRFCVDHCHKTLKVRGLLCEACNSALGLYRDNIALVRSAAAYLAKSGQDAILLGIFEKPVKPGEWIFRRIGDLK